MTKLNMTLGGVAVVCCVHDRQKREYVDRDKFLHALRQEPGFDEHLYLIHLCACCSNLFVSLDDTPRFCQPCQQPLVHPLGGPLPKPIGVV